MRERKGEKERENDRKKKRKREKETVRAREIELVSGELGVEAKWNICKDGFEKHPDLLILEQLDSGK